MSPLLGRASSVSESLEGRRSDALVDSSSGRQVDHSEASSTQMPKPFGCAMRPTVWQTAGMEEEIRAALEDDSVEEVQVLEIRFNQAVKEAEERRGPEDYAVFMR